MNVQQHEATRLPLIVEVVCGDWRVGGCLLWVTSVRCHVWQVVTIHHEVDFFNGLFCAPPNEGSSVSPVRCPYDPIKQNWT